jgi:hypothetical protein
MQTLSFGDSRLKVVLTQGKSSASAALDVATRKAAAAKSSLIVFSIR